MENFCMKEILAVKGNRQVIDNEKQVAATVFIDIWKTYNYKCIQKIQKKKHTNTNEYIQIQSAGCADGGRGEYLTKPHRKIEERWK